jgi:hypothetical protein
VLDLQDMRESLREQQFQAILELGVELQDILQEIKKLHNADPLPEGDLASPVEIVANPMTGRRKKENESKVLSETGPSKPKCSEAHPPTSACTDG